MLLRRLARLLAPLLIAIPLALILAESAVRLGFSSSPASLPSVRIGNRKADGDGNLRPNTLVLLCYPTNYRGYFKIDLADPKTVAHYEGVAMRNMDKALPNLHYAVEQPFNSQVYLGPEFPPRKEGVTRVVIMGDSFSMGWGLRLEDRISDRLEVLLNKRYPGRYQVLNASMMSGDFPALYYKFRDVLPLKPDILVFGMTLNDTLRKPELASPPLESSPLVMMRRGAQQKKMGFFDSRILAMFEKRRQDKADTQVMIDWYRKLGSDENMTGIVATRQYIREMDMTLKHRGGRFILALWPLFVSWDEGYPFQEIHERTAGFAGAREIEYVDFLPPMLKYKAEELWVHPVDRHPNEIASALAAERLAAAILTR